MESGWCVDCEKGCEIMTTKRVIKYLESHGFISDDVKDMCIKALEKQIPKKPDFEADGYSDGQLVYDTWICPNCEKHYEVDYDDYEYCPDCGQSIDWSDKE